MSVLVKEFDFLKFAHLSLASPVTPCPNSILDNGLDGILSNDPPVFMSTSLIISGSNVATSSHTCVTTGGKMVLYGEGCLGQREISAWTVLL
ncbi:hypothetical protein OWV82_025074 [Melia azedarach]|uniref:Uncharacterized protein n=1 Tax=Melia azedarach TaxID=155640 RepID=A0ACC1WSD5_MELAZ|nr:hypothetical protein OWV82_025074 [Melia azedarach]